MTGVNDPGYNRTRAVAGIASVAGVADPGHNRPDRPARSLKIDRPRKRPIRRPRHETRSHRIVPNVIPLCAARFFGTQQMIEKLRLPERGRPVDRSRDSLGGPFLPTTDRNRESRFDCRFRRDEKMHVIRHHDVGSDRPSVPWPHSVPLLAQDVVHFG